jgi:ABC-type nitrate/sulfonate/bicarbonate transport system ATPase subunit
MGDQPMEKEAIQNLPCTLEHIARCLNSAFKALQQVNDKNVIMAIGNTGCGKSTMLNGLVLGPESLEETTITVEMEIGLPNG